MDHLLFDALKISPIPMETANKVTEVGWMLEIEKILNSILESADKHYLELSDCVTSVIKELQAEINKSIEEMKTLPKTKEYADMLYNHIQSKIVSIFNSLIGESLGYITFGLENGYFVAYVPKSMDSITFETDLNPLSKDYGKLQVNY